MHDALLTAHNFDPGFSGVLFFSSIFFGGLKIFPGPMHRPCVLSGFSDLGVDVVVHEQEHIEGVLDSSKYQTSILIGGREFL